MSPKLAIQYIFHERRTKNGRKPNKRQIRTK